MRTDFQLSPAGKTRGDLDGFPHFALACERCRRIQKNALWKVQHQAITKPLPSSLRHSILGDWKMADGTKLKQLQEAEQLPSP